MAPARPVLVLDTSSGWCAAALRLPEGGAVERAALIQRGHAERLAPMVEALLAEAGVQASTLWRIGVATGPGSFAGTRVGVAFARGLALATGAQAVGISGLAAMAHALDPARDQTIAAIHDAGRGLLIWQVFTHGDAVTDVEHGDVDEARARLAQFGNVHLTGSGAVRLGADPAHFSGTPPLQALLELTVAAAPGAPLPAPLYARAPDAKLPGGISV